jgi:sodium-dependent dicarboxylate transporter 2/3/5
MGEFQANTEVKESFTRRFGLIIGPVVSLILLIFFDLDPGHPEVTKASAVALLMAVWWITEAVPLAITSLLPVLLFPLLNVMRAKEVAPIYFNHIIFLFIGAFMVALAMQRWGLHKRIGLKILTWIGVGPRRITLGFMVTTAFLSMWISNTAATMMMIPIALAVILKLEQTLGEKELFRFNIGFFLGIAHAATIGGIATLIGTPPNLSFARILHIYFPQAPEISFATWLSFALPLSVVFLILVWLVLTTIFSPPRGKFQIDSEIFKQEYRKLGPFKFEEKVVLLIFALMAFLWIFRVDITIGNFIIPGWSSILPVPDFVDDSTVAVLMAVLLFLIPCKSEKGGRIMNWATAVKLPWDIVLLFGGGFALASGLKESGLSTWLGNQLIGLSLFPPILIIVLICTMITYLTELTSNTATTEMVLPILAGVAVAIKINPLLLMVPATLSASCAFMMPVATPPNAIIFGTKRLRIADMAKGGILLNLIGIILITLTIYFLKKTSGEGLCDWLLADNGNYQNLT